MNTTLTNTILAGRLPTPSPAAPAKRTSRPDEPVLRFSPLAWLKLRTFLHADNVEIGGFGISAEDDLLYIEDFATVKQTVTSVSVEFDDSSVTDLVDRCVDAGISPARCGRAWIHTHPATSATPSITDEETFKRVFGQNDWAIMIILARGGATYVRLSFTAGPGGHVQIPLEVDWERLPDDLLENEGEFDEMFTNWLDEYGRNINPRTELITTTVLTSKLDKELRPPYHDSVDPLDELYDQAILDDDFISWVEDMSEVYP